ncbi:MAG: hypothetical protein J0H82_02890 [Alphaproteobacteria bacterium]|jgi:TPP-dependent pyruvate/acetoin dehydrogenase alpha subunit|nr:hypothetical protein [Alphaproteobacteria bacterium]
MSVPGISGNGSPGYGYGGVSQSSKDKVGTSVEDKFLAYARKTPAERFREDLLNSMGLTEEGLAAMDPDKRKAVEEEITRRMKEKIEKDSQKQAGFFTDVKA